MLLFFVAVVFVVLLLLSMPIVFSLAVAGIVGLWLGGYPMQQLPPGKRHQAFHAAVERLERERAFSLRRVQLHRRDEPREILVAGSRRDEDGEGESVDLVRWRSRDRAW